MVCVKYQNLTYEHCTLFHVVAENLKSNSKHSVLSLEDVVLCKVPIQQIKTYLDVYSLLSVELMHSFHIGVSKMIKEDDMRRLRYSKKTTGN